MGLGAAVGSLAVSRGMGLPQGKGQVEGLLLCLPALPLPSRRQAVEPGTMQQMASQSQSHWAPWRGSLKHGHGRGSEPH